MAGIALFAAIPIKEHRRPIVCPDHLLTTDFLHHERDERQQEHGTGVQPVTLSRPGDVQPIPHKNVFTAVDGQMIADPADNQ